ncbi:GlcG/HbpS family heme-binding protein [Enterovirga aerilata]|uniref:Heme-binding protein n=1 Tax=Enterovirga aerilata TaxID=2730920 RepID=A0A849I9N8_9HYPH|nr:heme-binding protein [Enterovirga sp. DB1703]NNM72790.1 heme-binding protein [Enterovirga sp. DB1703]
MLTLDQAHKIMHAALDEGTKRNLKPLSVLVLDARGALKAAASQDGTSLSRDKVAYGKAFGALSLGLGSRALHRRAEEQPYFISAVNGLLGGALVPVPGGVLIKDQAGTILGAVGISGDTSDNDEACAAAGIAAAGLVADAG